MIIIKDRIKPSLYPNTLNLSKILIYAIVYGTFLAISTVAFFSAIVKTSFFPDKFGVTPFLPRPQTDPNPGWNHPQLHSIVYLQVSIISQALIFIIRSRSFFFLERPSMILVCAFAITQLIATLIAVYSNWAFTDVEGCGWSWAAIVWLWSVMWLFPLDLIKVKGKHKDFLSTYFLLYSSLLFALIFIQRKSDNSLLLEYQ